MAAGDRAMMEVVVLDAQTLKMKAGTVEAPGCFSDGCGDLREYELSATRHCNYTCCDEGILVVCASKVPEAHNMTHSRWASHATIEQLL